jgi:TolA-binding protein
MPRERPSRAHTKVASVQAATMPSPAASAPAPDLKTLFAAASDARKAGDPLRAAELYTEIERRFPDSREARLSFVAFGRMLLDRGERGRALEQFERYLSVAPTDVLAAEASYGRARALVSLGRAAEARRAWAELLSRFPDSIYADVARRQLGQPENAK